MNRHAAREVIIDGDHAGQRIDNFLITLLKGVPRARIYRGLRRGEFRVNKGRIRQFYRLQSGDVVRVPPISAPAPGEPAAAGPGMRERLRAAVLLETDRLMVLDKPSGMAVHGGSAQSLGVIEALRSMRPPGRFLELAHRLDRDTSGCLVIAKSRSALLAMHRALREGRVDKRYELLVEGRWSDARAVDSPLLKNTLRSGERVVRVSAAGRPALTRFDPIVSSPRASHLLARPVTGRTHQIRVHAAAAGHPIAGDEKYGSRAFNQDMRDIGLRRLFLHAASIGLNMPEADLEFEVHAPMPAALGSCLAALELSAARRRVTPRTEEEVDR